MYTDDTALPSLDIESLSASLLKAVADIDGPVGGAYNLRRDGASVRRFSTKNVQIRERADGRPGIDVMISPGAKGESVHIPVILTDAGADEVVYNDFIIGEGADVTIVAGCAIHNCCDNKREHDGVHTFNIGKNARLRYSEKHMGSGEGSGARVLNPTTVVRMAEGSFCEMEMTQLKGVSSTVRETSAYLGKNARLSVVEKLLTHGEQSAVSNIDIHLDGEDATARIISRSVAKGASRQQFAPVAVGNAACRAHIQCDSIIMDAASVRSVPAIEANHQGAQIVHEAAIGRINSDQLVKLMTLGMEEAEAEQVIIDAFLE